MALTNTNKRTQANGKRGLDASPSLFSGSTRIICDFTVLPSSSPPLRFSHLPTHHHTPPPHPHPSPRFSTRPILHTAQTSAHRTSHPLQTQEPPLRPPCSEILLAPFIRPSHTILTEDHNERLGFVLVFIRVLARSVLCRNAVFFVTTSVHVLIRGEWGDGFVRR